MLSFITQLTQRFQAWKERWFGTLGDYETALGIYHDRLGNTYRLWVSYEGLYLFWLSGHHTRADAEAALPRVIAWAKSQKHLSVRPEHALGMLPLRKVGDFPATRPSERIEAEILRQIKERTPEVIIVDRTPTENDWEAMHMPHSRQAEAATDEWTPGKPPISEP